MDEVEAAHCQVVPVLVEAARPQVRMPDPGRGSRVDETPQQTEEVVNVPQQQHQQTDPHHGPEIVMNDQETWEGEEGEDGDVGESSSEHPTDETLPIAQFYPTIDNP